MPGHWKYAQDTQYNKDIGAVGLSATAAGKQQQKKSGWGKWGGMIGSIGLPLLVASAFASGGATMPLLAGAISAGVGGFAGRKAGSRLAGEDKSVIQDTKFASDVAKESQLEVDKAITARKTGDIQGSLIDAGTFAVKGLAESTQIGAKAKDWYRTKVFGPEAAEKMGTAAAGTSDPGVTFNAFGTTEKFGDIFEGANIKDKMFYGTGPEVGAWRAAKKAGTTPDPSMFPHGTDISEKPWYYKYLEG